MGREGLQGWQRICTFSNNARLHFHRWQLCSEQVLPQNAGHRPYGVTSTIWNDLSDKIVQEDVTNGVSINNTWMHQVKVVHACVCACVFLHVHMYWGRCECWCVQHKRNVNKVCASPVITPASASSHSSSFGSRDAAIQLDAGFVSLDSHQNRKTPL